MHDELEKARNDQYETPGQPTPPLVALYPSRSGLILHGDQIFEHDTIHLNSHMFMGCTFKFCTLIIQGPPFTILSACHFGACTVQVDFGMHDREVAERQREFVRQLIGCLPKFQPSSTISFENGSAGRAESPVFPPFLGQATGGGDDQGSADGDA